MHADLRSVSGTTVKAGVVVYTWHASSGELGTGEPLGCACQL